MTFSQSVLRWYDLHGRKLPWRGETDPYRIWLSEIMLQQTRAETVEKRYGAFLARFPNLAALAGAEEGEVLKAWEGLGYYARARNLLKAARLVVRDFGGRLPASSQALRNLPGVGAYAACSIASIAFGEAVPALDGNLARVFCRVLARSEPLASPADLYDEAASRMDCARPGDFNQALMDIGATVCTPRTPKCGDCPLLSFCLAGQSGCAEDFPVKLPKPPRREEERTVLLILLNGKVLVRQRAEEGLLARLWEFPALPERISPEALPERLSAEGFRGAKLIRALPEASHAFTHLTWRMTGALLTCAGAPGGFLAADAPALEALAMPSALAVYRACAMEALSRSAP